MQQLDIINNFCKPRELTPMNKGLTPHFHIKIEERANIKVQSSISLQSGVNGTSILLCTHLLLGSEFKFFCEGNLQRKASIQTDFIAINLYDYPLDI